MLESLQFPPPPHVASGYQAGEHRTAPRRLWLGAWGAVIAAALSGCSDAGGPSALESAGDSPAPAGTQRPPGAANQGPAPGANDSPTQAEAQPPLQIPAPGAGTTAPPSEAPPAAAGTFVSARSGTPSVDDYDDAPGSADPDDPAVWVDPNASGSALIIGTLKEAGLQVYDTAGKVLQSIAPPNRPLVTAADPPTPIGAGDATAPCPGSETGADFGRFNNVDVEYGFAVTGSGGVTRNVDIAVVSDRGCDNLRIYAIDPARADGPLIDITADEVPRLFPARFEQPSPVQSPELVAAEVANPLEDQNTAYGLTTFRLDGDGAVNAIVSQNNRGVLAQFELRAAGNGRVGYRRVRQFRFSPVFRVEATDGRALDWTACREDPAEDLQFEGLVVDEERGTLYAAQEVIGLWQIPLDEDLPEVVQVPQSQLFERTLAFGAPFWAVPSEGEFSCESVEPATATPGTRVGPGVAGASGEHLQADVEGLALYDAGDGEGYLIASSQGDDTFHVYNRADVTEHDGSFQVALAGETDGHEIVSVPFGPQFPRGALVLQNGQAAPPANVSPINGFEFDGSGGFLVVGWEDIASALGLIIADPDDVLDD